MKAAFIEEFQMMAFLSVHLANGAFEETSLLE